MGKGASVQPPAAPLSPEARCACCSRGNRVCAGGLLLLFPLVLCFFLSLCVLFLDPPHPRLHPHPSGYLSALGPPYFMAPGSDRRARAYSICAACPHGQMRTQRWRGAARVP